MNSHANYVRRVNAVIDHISERLDQKLTLDELAGIACFSPFHFHRIFKGVVGENLYSFIKRIRLEKAANRLCYNVDEPITNIALDCGFSTSANFSAAFKERFGVTPSDYRSGIATSNRQDDSKIPIANSKSRVSEPPDNQYPPYHQLQRRISEMKPEIKELPAYRVAYVRHFGRYEDCGPAWEKLCKWAGPRGVFGRNTLMIGLCHDNPDVTSVEKCRYDACVTLPDRVEPSGEIGCQTTREGTYAVFKFDDKIDNLGQAYDAIFSEWMPESGYQPDDCPSLDIFLTDPDSNPERRVKAEICIPVKPLE